MIKKLLLCLLAACFLWALYATEPPEPAPRNLRNIQDRVGNQFRFLMTGITHGGLWGCNDQPPYYAISTSPEMAAVHAGFLSPDEQGIITMEFFGPATDFISTEGFGYTSNRRADDIGSYRIISVEPLHRPSTQARLVSISPSEDSNEATLTWERGDGDAVIVFAKEGLSDAAYPIQLEHYRANTRLGIGSRIGATGWICVYKGTDNKATISRINPTKDYSFTVLEFNYPHNGFEHYNTSPEGATGWLRARETGQRNR